MNSAELAVWDNVVSVLAARTHLDQIFWTIEWDRQTLTSYDCEFKGWFIRIELQRGVIALRAKACRSNEWWELPPTKHTADAIAAVKLYISEGRNVPSWADKFADEYLKEPTE